VYNQFRKTFEKISDRAWTVKTALISIYSTSIGTDGTFTNNLAKKRYNIACLFYLCIKMYIMLNIARNIIKV
jgi:hypothetical protein